MEVLNEILEGINPERFFADYWGKSILHNSGSSTRFEHLLRWSDLDLILETHRISSPRLRLVKNGESLEPDLYTAPKNKNWPGKLKGGSFVARLQQGATLVLDSIHELAPPIRDLSESLARTLKSHVIVNLYASWCRENGFDLHWDDQDVMILQVSGRKRWTVYKPTQENPLKNDSLSSPEKPDQQEPVWDQILNAGEMLYLPRGWWHIVTPINEPSMHLTVTIVPPNGVDFVRWLRKAASIDSHIRGNIPRLNGDNNFHQYFDQLRRSMIESLTVENFHKFLRSWDADNPLPSRIRLPVTSSESPSLTATSRVRLSSHRYLDVTAGNTPETINFRTGPKTWKGSTSISPALTLLSGEQSHTLQNLCDLLGTDEAIREFKMLAMALLMEGVLVIEA